MYRFTAGLVGGANNIVIADSYALGEINVIMRSNSSGGPKIGGLVARVGTNKYGGGRIQCSNSYSACTYRSDKAAYNRDYSSGWTYEVYGIAPYYGLTKASNVITQWWISLANPMLIPSIWPPAG